MKKLFLIPLMALTTCVMAFATNVSDLSGLQTALATGGEITLTANIDAGATQLNIAKGVTINGEGFAIKSTSKYVFAVTTTDAVAMENLVIWAAKTNKAGRGIVMGDAAGAAYYDNIDLTLTNVTINATYRAIDMWYGDGQQLTINNCTFQNVQGQAVDGQGNPTAAKYDIELTSANAGDTRGLNFGQLTNSTITINNSTMQGFFYVLNNVTGSNGNMTGSKLTATNSTFKGRAALNVWGYGAEYVFSDCNVVGINNYGGSSEGFACFVFNNQNTCHDNSLTINGGTVVSAVFNEVGGTNPHANQYFIADRATNNTIVINNAAYSCTKDLGIQKGGLLENVGSGSTVTVNGGSYDCPEIIESNTGGGEVIINGGDFDVIVVTSASYFPAGYETRFDNVADNITVNGGTFQLADESDINALSFAANEESTPKSIVSTTTETIENQDGTVSVVPAGTKDNTSSATSTEIAWNNSSDWTVPTATSNVVIAANQTVTLEGADGAAYRIDMGDGAKLIVKNGTTLTIGKGGVALYNGGTTKPQIIIEQGAKVITYGLMYGSVAENLIIKASADGYGQLLIDPQAQAYGDNHPMGTVEFVTKSFYKDAEHYQFERFGIPTWNTLESITCDVDGLSTGIYIYENNNWQNLGYLKKGTAFANTSRLNKPFVACNLIAYQEAVGATYQFAGSLMGNSNADLKANLEWNPFANSYTADVDLVKLLDGLASGINVDPTVYLATPAGLGTYTWDPFDAEWFDGKLAPMQAFILHNHGTEVETSKLNYTNMVWKPGTGASAPRRFAANDRTARVRIVVANEQGVWDNVKFTEKTTDLHNATKYMNDDVNIYAMTDEKAAIVAAENLENTYVGFSTVKGGKFTISFANVEGREFDLIDHETGARVNIAEGNTYEFTANGSNDYRFEIVSAAKMPTAIENAEAVKSAKGVYTITGQYMGEMNVWNTLPAGVYVVNGEKRVK